jgi:hypothetical protein
MWLAVKIAVFLPAEIGIFFARKVSTPGIVLPQQQDLIYERMR